MNLRRLKTFMDQVENPVTMVIQLVVYKLIAKIFQLNHSTFRWIVPIRVNSFNAKYVFQIFNQLSIEDKKFYEVFENKDYRTLIDVGSSIGYVSDYFLRLSPGRKVYCFEPQKEFALFSEKHLKTRIYQCAIFNYNGIMEFYTRKKHDREGSLKNKHKNMRTVNVRTLDSFDFRDIDLIKYDIEGAEYEAILGSLETIKRNVPDIIFETHNNKQLADITKILSGYNIICLGALAGSNGKINNYLAKPK